MSSNPGARVGWDTPCEWLHAEITASVQIRVTEKSITDFIKKGFEEGDFEMMTDGTEERQFLYAEDCCEALETIMECYTQFKPEDPLHITSFNATSIKDVAAIITGQFNLIGKQVKINPGLAKDSVQMDKRNEANNYIMDWWLPKTNMQDGIAAVFNEMKKEYGY